MLAAAFSLFVYRRTIPPVPPAWRGLLAALRMLALMLVLLLLFEPILSVTRRKEKKPVVAVLIDDSASMTLRDGTFDRKKELEQTLQAPVFQNPGTEVSFRYFPFSHTLQNETARPDSMALTGDGTDIHVSLKKLKEGLSEEYFAATILITDGADNLGANPARLAKGYGVPIHPIAIGDPAQQKDVLVSNYATNEIAYAGNDVPVDVYVAGHGFDKRRIQVRLMENSKAVDTQFITLNGDGMEQKVRLSFTAEEPGMHKYDIRVPEIDTELTGLNNVKSFYTKILKSKIKALVVAGAPSPDLLFLKRTLRSLQNIDVTTFVEKKNGAFYEGAQLPVLQELQEFDCILLVDYPRKSTTRASQDRLREILAQGKPVLFLAGRLTDIAKLMAWKAALPFEAIQKPQHEKQVFVRVLPQGLYHPLLRLSEDDLENKRLWQDLPPVYSNLPAATLNSSSQTLAVSDMAPSGATAGQAPFLTVHDSGKRKSVGILGYGLWRWDFLMWGVGKSNAAYRQLLDNIVRWLTTREDNKLVKVATNKEIYRSGEKVEFTGQVYFEDFQPVDGAEVVVQLKNAGESQELTLTNIGNGRYAGDLQFLSGGDYEFTATAHQQSRIIGRDEGRFSVETFSHEYQNTQMNQELLQQIASASGGTFFTSQDFSALQEELSFREQYVSLESEWELRNKVALLVACLILLVTEWFIRKRKGML